MAYNNDLLTVGALYDDTNAIKQYNDQMLNLVKSEYTKKNIDFYKYEHFINIIQITSLRLDEMKDKMNRLIDKQAHPGLKMDVSV